MFVAMTTRGDQKKRSARSVADWHQADIVAALRKAGWSLRRLSKHHGYNPTSLSTVLQKRKWRQGEKVIADAIGVAPETIWPSRYKSDRPALRSGQPKSNTA